MTILVVGSLRNLEPREVRTVVEKVGEQIGFLPSPSHLADAVTEQVPRCVLVDAEADIREVSRTLCARTDCFGVPVIAVTRHVSQAAWVELHRLGADDLVAAHDMAGLTRRLAALATFDPSARTPLGSGTALIAHGEPDRRQLLGRVLRQAGFEALFAGNQEEACRVGSESPPKVVIVSQALPPHGGTAALAKLASFWVGEMPAVLLTSGRADGMTFGPRWSHVAEDAPPDDLVFTVNELLRPRDLIEARASRRILHATLCAFRSAGELDMRVGLTYNLSREGIYVRTFDAPLERGGLMWLELRPPGAEAFCHLRGETMWIRGLVTGTRGATPPGFGVKLCPDLCPAEDLRLYREHYDQLRAREAP